MVSHALWDMFQDTVIVLAAVHVGPANQYTQSAWPAQYSSVAICNTKTNSLGKEIKSTSTDSVTVNQPPQSGICWDTTLVPQVNPKHDH